MIATIAAVAITIFGILHGILRWTQDAREPPVVPTFPPFIGHLAGLTRKNKLNLPIYTLRLPGSKLYVVNSTALIPAVQKQYKTLAFPPLEAKFAQNICGSSKVARDILNTNVNGEDGDWGYSMTFYKMLKGPLSPGFDLDGMNRVMAQAVAASIETFKEEKVVKLFDFISHEITLATTESVYGSKNPYRDPAIEKSFWKYPAGLMIMLLDLYPSIFAKESVEARERIAKDFIRYFKENGHHEGSALIKARFEHSIENGIPLEDIARFEVGGGLTILANTSPSAFWMAFHVCSNPVALEECRNELAAVVTDTATTSSSGNTMKVRTLDMTTVKTSCPTLPSTFQEVLRVHSVGISTRLVMEDHLLDGKYLLKKGGTIMIPGPVQHTNANSWGTNVESFDHRRFLQKTKNHNPVSFRGFGGVSGKWVCPTTNNSALWETTPVPDFDIDVRVTPRAGEGPFTKWRIVVTDSDKAMPPSVEDM